MEITTETLLEKYGLSNLIISVVGDLSFLKDGDIKHRIINQNQNCGIIQTTDDEKKHFPFIKYVAGILHNEFLRLLEEEKLNNLIGLNFSSAKLTNLPSKLWQLTDLIFLNLSNNELPSIPDTIGQLNKLASLNLSSNKFVSLPPEIGKLNNLDALNLYSNQLVSLPAETGNLINLTTLNLSSNQLTSIPAEIGQLTNLQELNLSKNQLASLPTEIGQLTYLTLLDLDLNELTHLPAQIGKLTNLIELRLRANRLTSLPVDIGKLTKLTVLGLKYNNLTSLPAEIGKLTSLAWAELFDNQLSSLPAEIGQLNNLIVLILKYNKLVCLPAEIGQLTCLIELDISNNQLSSLPAEIQNLKLLEKLDLSNNELDLPLEILENIYAPQTILDYFAWTLNGKRKPIAETKLLVLGQGTVGKTSLIQRIIHDRFDEHENKTEGIAIEKWEVEQETGHQQLGNKETPGPNTQLPDTPISVNIWDFGGQEIMHATHQFFLTKRSLYMLVLDSRSTQEENRVEYWLKIIQSFGGESPVLLVGNKSDQHPLDIDRSGLQKKYPNIVGILETSAATGAGIDTLKAVISEQVNKLPHVHDMLPESWFNVKQRLEEQRSQSNFITLGKYTELCTESEIRDESSQRTLIGFLHDLGVVLHFQDDLRLEALGILNPQWVTNGVYKIINTRSLMENRGVLTVVMLNEILNLPEEYPRDKRLFMIDMMKKFELCYELETDKSFLVPDLLPKDEPDLDFQGTPAFEYLYPVLPSSVMTRFIVRMSAKIDAGQVWRSGVLLKIGGNRALVKGDVEDRTVSIHIDGMEHTRRDALAAIRFQLDEIHASIKGLNPEKLVPVPDAVQAKPLKYDYLLKLERAGEETLLVEDGDNLKKINVSQMLNAVESEYERKQAGNTTNIYTRDVSGNIIAGHHNRLND